ncbi:E3 ubiquitin-protein ligase RNF13-like [Solanum pennellii]|uniref:RING-type E3 ubiquitin transferase n=1 Tax=Solanum pennellii TaxID=28526 RepID=A0ABM1V9D1_SOLPN|nr:E3 ubiquitin-protein ligase RNF13-like [Solanum pennellii]
MWPTGFVCHDCFKHSFVSVKPISEEEKWIIPPITSSYSSSLPVLTIHCNFKIIQQFWYMSPNNLGYVNMGEALDSSSESTQIILHLSDTKLYERLDCAISEVFIDFKDEFEDLQHIIVEKIIRKLKKIMTKQILEVCMDVTIMIDHQCHGGILLESEELPENGMVPASKSSIELLEPMEVDERYSNDECLVCLDEIGKKTRVLRLPCSHMFHADCITMWLENSHYCPL